MCDLRTDKSDRPNVWSDIGHVVNNVLQGSPGKGKIKKRIRQINKERKSEKKTEINTEIMGR